MGKLLSSSLLWCCLFSSFTHVVNFGLGTVRSESVSFFFFKVALDGHDYSCRITERPAVIFNSFSALVALLFLLFALFVSLYPVNLKPCSLSNPGKKSFFVKEKC